MRYTLNRLVAQVTSCQLHNEGTKDVVVVVPGVGELKVIGVESAMDKIILRLEQNGRS